MAQPPSGQVLALERDRGRVYALRFRAYGQRRYLTLGAAGDGWTQSRAELELQNVLADVRRGIWRPPAPEPAAEPPEEEPTFHAYASTWLVQREAEGLKPRTIVDLRGSLVNHLLPFFAEHRLSDITPREVKRYTHAKLAERNAIEARRTKAMATGERPGEQSLSNSSINHTLRHLAQVLESAVDDELIAANPATGKRRRLKSERPARPWVEPEQLPTFLESAGSDTGRLLLELLTGAGLRIGEALGLRWQHVDLGVGSLYVVDAKTAKGVREVHVSPALRERLTLAKADASPAPDAHVIATGTGHKHNPSNLRRDVLAPTIALANEQLAKLGIAPIPGVTFHSLRRTYASLRCACGDDLRYAADQLGHEDPRFTLKAYAQATKRRDRLSPLHRREFDRAIHWALLGTVEALTVPVAEHATA